MPPGTERDAAEVPGGPAVRAALQGSRFERVRWIAETGSTNDDLLRAARAGEPEQVLITDLQTAGRGRRDRVWDAPPQSSILMSILVRDRSVADAFWTVAAVGLSAVEAAASVAQVECSIKWPNDVLVGHAKVAGVLAQIVEDAVIVGIGVNVNWPGSMTDVIGKRGTGLEPTALNHHRPDREPVPRPELVVEMLRGVGRWLDAPAGELRRSWLDACSTIGRRVRLDLASGPMIGQAVDITESGALVLDVAGRRSVHEAGDVIHLRTPS